MYEHRRQPLLSRREFAARLIRHGFSALAVLLASLGFGMWGYHHFEGLDWVAAFLNSSMLLGGMGPVDAPHTTAGKLFAGGYALFAGLIFIVVAGVVVGPVLHRLLHHFHVDVEEAG